MSKFVSESRSNFTAAEKEIRALVKNSVLGQKFKIRGKEFLCAVRIILCALLNAKTTNKFTLERWISIITL